MSQQASPEDPPTSAAAADLTEILRQARRIPNDSGWFEIIELPNDVYAFWEPGHAEEVNAFLIVGTDRDVLYDTGMGIASIGAALADLRSEMGWPERELMLINSHNHLDHNGGNADFGECWIIENEWAIRKLTEGITGRTRANFIEYWAALKDYPGVQAPADFDPENFDIPPFTGSIRFLADGDVVDLGNRRFRVIHTTSHSPDGLALYDEDHGILFGGDTFIGDEFLVRNLDLLEQDLVMAKDLQVEWHYCSHGPQLIEVMRSGYHLSIVRRISQGERTEGETTFFGDTLPVYELDGVVVLLGGDTLTY